MLRQPIRLLTITALPLLLATACFEDPAADTSSGTESGDGDGDTTGDGDGDGDSGDGDGDSGDGDGDSGDGDGDGDSGPQIISSIPAADDLNAGLEPYFLLYFDRVVDDGDAAGKFLVTQGDSEPTPVVVMPCPDLDPTCLAGLYPMNLLVDDRLPPNTPHQVIVSAGFEDPDGNATSVDQTVPYETFAYEANWFDDAVALPTEVGGLSYNPGSDSLFIVGEHPDIDGPRVRKIPLLNGAPQPAVTVLEIPNPPGGPPTYGLDRYGNQLYVSLTYAGEVRQFANLGMDMLAFVEAWTVTTLPEPHADVEEVWSVARSADQRIFFAWGDFHGGVNGNGIVQQDMFGTWSMFNDGKDLWEVSQDGVMLTIGNVNGTEYLFVSADAKLYKFRLADGQLQTEYDVEQAHTRDLEVDSQGRLWYGTQSGIWVYGVFDDNLTELAKRGGVPCGRIALREQEETVHAYCVSFRDSGIISHVPVDF